MAQRSRPLRVLLAGGSGLVGRALLQALLEDPQVGQVLALQRRAVSDWPAHPKLQALTVDFRALPTLPPLDEAYLAVGTTLRQAGSREAFMAVDRDAQLAAARAAQAAGVQRLLVVSAQGADAHSPVFYSRVKGEVEQAIAALGLPVTVFARPSLLLGDRAALGQPRRLGEALAQRGLAPLARWLPRAVRPIPARQVAQSLHRAARRLGPGVHVLSSADLGSDA